MKKITVTIEDHYATEPDRLVFPRQSSSVKAALRSALSEYADVHVDGKLLAGSLTIGWAVEKKSRAKLTEIEKAERKLARLKAKVAALGTGGNQ